MQTSFTFQNCEVTLDLVHTSPPNAGGPQPDPSLRTHYSLVHQPFAQKAVHRSNMSQKGGTSCKRVKKNNNTAPKWTDTEQSRRSSWSRKLRVVWLWGHSAIKEALVFQHVLEAHVTGIKGRKRLQIPECCATHILPHTSSSFVFWFVSLFKKRFQDK